jgi:PAS domain S-box-containing protein
MAEAEKLTDVLPQRPAGRVATQTIVLRYGAAVLSVTTMLIVALSLRRLGVTAPGALFLCAVVFSGLYGGLGPGLLSLALSLLAFDYFFTPPGYSLAIAHQEVSRFLVFSLLSIFALALSARHRNATESLRHARDVLSETVENLQRTNEALRAENADRTRAEALLLATEQQFRAIVEHSPDQIIQYDRDCRRTYVNPAVAQGYGIPLQALIGQPLDSVVQGPRVGGEEENVDLVRSRIAAVFESGKSFDYEMDWPMRTGRTFFSVRMFPEFAADGSVAHVLVIARDITERKLAEDVLVRQKEILQTIFDSIPVMINFVGSEGRIHLVSREWERVLGWTLEEIHRKRIDIFKECYPDPAYRQEVLEFLRSATGDWQDFKTRTRDGTVIDTSWARIRLSDGTTIGIGQDITERKQAEFALRKSEDHFRLVIDTIPTLVWSALPDGSVEYINQRFREFSGRSLGEARDWRLSSFVHPEDLEAIAERWRMSLATGKPYEVEGRLQSATGEYHWFLSRAVPLRDEAGAIIKWYGTQTDITERKQAEEASRKSEDRLRLVIDRIPTMAWSLRADGVMEFISQRWIDYTGVSLEEESKEPTQVIHPDDVPRALQDWATAVAFGLEFENELRLRGADGNYRWFLIRTSPVHDEKGNIVKWYGVSTDIEDRKQAEDRLKATTEQLRALSASVQSAREDEGTRIAREIHDELGAALSSLRWDLEDIDEAISGPPSRAQLATLHKKIEAMIDLSDATVNTVRRIASELRPTALDEFGITEAIRWHAQHFQARTGITVNCDSLLEDLDLSREQATGIFRISQEALTNVLRHARASRVDVTMKREAGSLVVTIRDNGQGITAEEKSRPQSLGLLGMRERAHLIGGVLDISGSAGVGTVVTIQLPIANKP